MSKRIFSLFLLLLAPFLLTACGSSVSDNTNTGTNTGNNSKNTAPRRPDFGQPETQPEIRGVVKSVVGNEVTVLKIDQLQGAGLATSTGATRDTNTKPATLSLGGANTGGPGGPGGMGGGRPQGGGIPGGDNSATDRTAMLEKIKAMSTGEETITIPVGIKMLKADPENTDKQRVMVEATISDITVDKMITVWLNNSVTDKKVASFVMIN